MCVCVNRSLKQEPLDLESRNKSSKERNRLNRAKWRRPGAEKAVTTFSKLLSSAWHSKNLAIHFHYIVSTILAIRLNFGDRSLQILFQSHLINIISHQIKRV